MYFPKHAYVLNSIDILVQSYINRITFTRSSPARRSIKDSNSLSILTAIGVYEMCIKENVDGRFISRRIFKITEDLLREIWIEVYDQSPFLEINDRDSKMQHATPELIELP